MAHFLLISPARAGSTSLRLTLNAVPDVLCHGEILGKNRVLGVAAKLRGGKTASVDMRATDPEGFMTLLLDSAGFRLSGFKALYSHFFLDQNARFIDGMLARRPRVVFLWRRDLVGRCLSECRLRFLEIQSNPHKFARISVADIVKDARQQMQMVRDIRARLAAQGITDILDIDFEDLVAGPQPMAAVMGFLGLDAAPPGIVKDVRTVQNEKQPQKVAPPASFAAPAVARFGNVSLTEALAMAGTAG